MFCNKCGTQLSDEAVFCNKCGNKIETVHSEQQTEIQKANTVQFENKTKKIKEMTPQELSEFMAIETQKVKKSIKITAVSLVIAFVSVIIAFNNISDNTDQASPLFIFLLFLALVSFIVALVSGSSIHKYIENIMEIPEEYKTKNQRMFANAIYLIGAIFIIIVIIYILFETKII